MTSHKRMNGTRRMTDSVDVRLRRPVAVRTRETAGQRTPPAACRPIASALEARPATSGAAPIWFAALAATRCQASGSGEGRSVSFEYVAGRAWYTNTSATAESIDPLGVTLQGGHTLAVYWIPGETAYTLEVFGQNQRYCA
jgi:hypothetical protein